MIVDKPLREMNMQELRDTLQALTLENEIIPLLEWNTTLRKNFGGPKWRGLDECGDPDNPEVVHPALEIKGRVF